jgi:menaquinol-cytochrome c reductase iron-sulfur subunit
MPPPARRPTPTESRLTADRNVPGAFAGETITRRRLVTTGANVAGAVAAAAIVLPALGFALGPVGMRTKVTWQAIGPPEAFSEHTFVARTITFAPDLGSIGKTTVFARRRNRRLDTEPGDRWTQVIVLTSRCSHVGCPVGFYDAAGSYLGPCHGGDNDLRGLRTGGPPPRPLDRFYTRVRRGLVEVGPRYSVDSALHRFSPRDPGEPLDGIGKYLYPPRPTTAPAPH